MIISTITGTDNVTLELVKKHLNISFSDDDTYLTGLINVSLSAVENYCRNAFIERSNVQNIGQFDGSLPQLLMTDNTYTPNDEIITINYTLGTVSETRAVPIRNLYTFTKDHFIYSLNKIVIQLIESIEVDIDTDVTLTWNTGQKDLMDQSIVQARLLLIGTYYENRESVGVGVALNELPNGVQYLLEAYMYPQLG